MKLLRFLKFKRSDEYDSQELNVGDDPADAKKKKALISIAAAAAAMVLVITLGLTVRKTSVDAVLSNKAQGDLIESISEQLSTLQGSVITKEEADEIAAEVVKDNFSDLFLSNMQNYSEEEILDMIQPAIEQYLGDSFSSEEINQISKDVSKKVMEEIDGINGKVSDLNKSIESLGHKVDDIDVKNYDTDITGLRDADAANKSEILGIVNTNKQTADNKFSSVDNDIEEVEKKVSDLSKNLNLVPTSTSLISYVLSGENSKWIAVSKEYKASDVTVSEFLSVLAQNDTETAKAVNKLQTAFADKIVDLDEKIESIEKTLNESSMIKYSNGDFYAVSPDGNVTKKLD